MSCSRTIVIFMISPTPMLATRVGTSFLGVVSALWQSPATVIIDVSPGYFEVHVMYQNSDNTAGPSTPWAGMPIIPTAVI